jgi:hypothetical protein
MTELLKPTNGTNADYANRVGALIDLVNRRTEEFVSVTDFGATGDGSTDDTDAIQEAAATGQHVWFPPGTYKITDAITVSTHGQVFAGSGMEESIINFTGASTKCFVGSGTFIRMHIRDLYLLGGAGTSHAIDTSAGLLYTSTFENLWINSVGKCLYAPDEFNNLYKNVQFSSSADHGLEVSGSNTTTFLNCYAHTFAALKYPYRIYGQALMISCNGVDSGDYIVLAGSAIGFGDAADIQYRLTCINCNFEDFKKNAIQLRYNGTFIEQNCGFVPPAVATSATYDCCVYIEYCDILCLFQGGFVASKGAARNKQAEIYSEAGQAPMCFNFAASWDNATTLSSIPNMTTTIAEYARYALAVKDVKATGSVYVANYLEGDEIVDPAAPTANKGRAYFRDNGAGKTQFVVRFPTGAVQVIATEP